MNPEEYYEEAYEFTKGADKRVQNRLNRKISKEMLVHCKEHIKINGKTILDIGCGAGECLVTFAIDGGIVTGLTPRNIEIETAKIWLKQQKLKGTLVKGVAEDLPFEDNSFDMIILAQCIEHVKDRDVVMDEMYRVLKPKGHLLITAPNNIQPYEHHFKTIWLPFTPKPLCKLYVKYILNKDPHILDNIHWITRYGIMNNLTKRGFKHIANFNGNHFYSSIYELYQKW